MDNIMKFKISTLIRLCALVLIILFFVPTSIASCSSYGITASVDISPFNLAIGNLKMETNDPDETADEAEAIESIEAKPVLFVMLALSAVVVALGSKVPILGAILSVGNAVAIFIMHLKIAEYIATEYEGMSVELEKTAAYYIYIIVAVVIAVILMLVQFGIFSKQKSGAAIRKDIPSYGPKENYNTEYIPHTDGTKVDNTPNGRVCGHCGCVCGDNEMFCGNCGEKLNGPTSDKPAPTMKTEVPKTPAAKTNSESKPNSSFHAPDDLN
jgi:hypothetical protein